MSAHGNLVFPLLTLLFPGAACDPDKNDTGETKDSADSTTDTSDSSDPCLDPSPEIALSDSNNYLFSGSLDITGYPLAAPGDPLIDWSAVDTDLLGHPLDPATEILTAAVVVFEQLSEAEVEEALATDSLDMADVTIYVSVNPEGATQAYLSEFTLMGNDIDVESYFVEGTGTWLLILTDTLEVGVGARMAAFLEPTASSKETMANITNESATLNLDVDMSQLEPLVVPTETVDLQLDWSGLSRNGRGTEWVENTVDRVMIAHFADKSPADLQERFTDLELLADPIWNFDIIGGDSADLGELAAKDPSFTGTSTEGTWAMALVCTSCANPAPPFFTILQACE